MSSIESVTTQSLARTGNARSRQSQRTDGQNGGETSSTVQARPSQERVSQDQPALKTSGGQTNNSSSAQDKALESPVQETVDELNGLLQSIRRELQFTVDDSSGSTVITVVDAETQQVVRQIPREQVSGLRDSLKTSGRSFMMDLEA